MRRILNFGGTGWKSKKAAIETVTTFTLIYLLTNNETSLSKTYWFTKIKQTDMSVTIKWSELKF